MKLRTNIGIVVAISALQFSCSVGPLTTTTGETAFVRLLDGDSENLEIVAVADSSILFLPAAGDRFRATSQVKEIPAASITHVEVSGFRNNNWWIGVLFFEVLPAAGMAAAASQTSSDPAAVFAVCLIPAAFTSLLYAVSGVPTPTFDGPLSNDQLLELRKYARFGGQLTPSQKEQLVGKSPRADVR